MATKVLKQTKQIVKDSLENGDLGLLYNVKLFLVQVNEQFPEHHLVWNEYSRQVDSVLPRRSFKETPCSGECSICMDSLRSGYTPACGHTFHEKCLAEWSQNSNACPMCRSEF